LGERLNFKQDFLRAALSLAPFFCLDVAKNSLPDLSGASLIIYGCVLRPLPGSVSVSNLSFLPSFFFFLDCPFVRTRGPLSLGSALRSSFPRCPLRPLSAFRRPLSRLFPDRVGCRAIFSPSVLFRLGSLFPTGSYVHLLVLPTNISPPHPFSAYEPEVQGSRRTLSFWLHRIFHHRHRSQVAGHRNLRSPLFFCQVFSLIRRRPWLQVCSSPPNELRRVEALSEKNFFSYFRCVAWYTELLS